MKKADSRKGKAAQSKTPDCVRDRHVQGRTHGLPGIEGNDTLPVDKPLPEVLLKKMVKARLAQI